MNNYLNLIQLYQKNQKPNNLSFYLALDGLSKGNMDSTLYNQFQNYVPRELDKNNPLHLLMAYQFALIDLQLYLDTRPNDLVVKELFNNYQKDYLQAKQNYEKINGPITLSSEDNTTMWNWQKNWPFSGGIK